ncbi:MAG: hypothetical protein ABI472_13100 [Ginsengibacter sp.]
MSFSNKHITKQYFFEIIQKRFNEYEEAIFGTRPGSRLHMMSVSLYNIQELKKEVENYKLAGDFFWGFGFNKICDGEHEYNTHDVFEIKKIGGLNKHHEPYRIMQLLMFKVENEHMYVCTFSFDTCKINYSYNLNIKYSLKDFENALIKKSINSTIIEFIFKSAEKPIRFQIDTYHYGRNTLSGEQLVKYYHDKMIEIVAPYKVPVLLIQKYQLNFINDFIKNIQELQRQDTNEECIRKLKEEDKRDESAFRFWFQKCFSVQGYHAEAEPVKGDGRIDLKVFHDSMSNKIIEFKEWWNSDRKSIIIQLCNYLTEFESEGFIFMINDKQFDIIKKYREIIESLEMRFMVGSWQEISVEPSGYSYFISKHDFSRKGKIIYHFIFPIYQITSDSL